MRRSLKLGTLVAVATVLITAQAALPATVRSIYELNGDFTDSLGNSPDLTTGGGVLGATAYDFAAQQGPSLSSGAFTTADYSIEMRFFFHTLSGFRKILDFKDLTSDNGFYTHGGPLSVCHSPGTTCSDAGANLLTADVLGNVILTRDGGTKSVSAYANGVLQISFTDTADDFVFTGVDHIVEFFNDDTATSGRESSGGEVDRIRIYNGALTGGQVDALQAGGSPPGLPGGQVPQPGTLALLGSGLIGALAVRWRRLHR